MLVFESLDSIVIPEPARPVHLAVGTFDGVHRGHAALIGGLAGEAHATGGQALVFTFQNHPRSIVSPDQCPPLLSPWPLKLRLLSRLPIDIVIGLKFTPDFAAIPAESFIRDILVGRCRAKTIHSGWNFRFGKGGYGGPGLLADLADDLGYRYEMLNPIKAGSRRISSSRVRECLAAGDVEHTTELLGRPHQIEALVVSGDAIGRTIGFPTANLAVSPETFLPADGVYAVHVFLEGEASARPGMMNIGFRPTIGGRQHRAEVHLIHFDGDLSGNTLTVQFVRRLREERKFAGVEELKQQLGEDRKQATQLLAASPSPRI